LTPSSIQGKDDASGLVPANLKYCTIEIEKQQNEIINEFRMKELQTKIRAEDLWHPTPVDFC
jgi:hypothetical protein